MKVKDLIAVLQKMNPEQKIVLSCDSEGNHYSPLAEAVELYYLADSTWSGEVYDDEDLIECEISKDEVEEVIVFYPTN